MARLFRSVCACVLVFGLCSVFSLGVSADVSMPSLGFPSLIAPVDPSATPVTYNYHAPKFAHGAYIDTSWDYCSLPDVGYVSRGNLYPGNNSTSAYVNWINPLLGYDSVSATLNNGIDFVSSAGGKTIKLIPNNVYGSFPVLRAGTTYLISCHIGYGVPTSFSFGLLDREYVNFNSKGTAEVAYTPVEDEWLGGTTFVINTTSEADTVRITSLKIQATDNSVVDAINNQTDEINKNHDETMHKIDDVTDFDEQEQSDLTGAVDGASDQINAKLGILSFGDHVLDQFIGIFDAAAGSPGITLPGFSIEVDGVQHVVWTDQVFDLSSIEDKFGPLMTAVHFATSFLVYAALVMYVQKIFGAIMQDWSDK